MNGWARAVMQASLVAWCLIGLWLMPGAVTADDAPPDDEFLEYLAAWDDVWEQACDPASDMPGDEACTETDDEPDQNP